MTLKTDVLTDIFYFILYFSERQHYWFVKASLWLIFKVTQQKLPEIQELYSAYMRQYYMILHMHMAGDVWGELYTAA